MSAPRFFPIVPGKRIPGDWFSGEIPRNIVVGTNSVIDSAFSFERYYATGNIGLHIGSHVTIWRASLSVEVNGVIEIGDYCFIANASIVCSKRIVIGSCVFVAGGATIADSDFHPLSAAARLADTVALSPIGNPEHRPMVSASPVIIEDNVWIGYNATILKGVRIGAGAIVGPGSVVIDDVPSGAHVTGNPAKPSMELSRED